MVDLTAAKHVRGWPFRNKTVRSQPLTNRRWVFYKGRHGSLWIHVVTKRQHFLA